jgi:hypothetical protein
LYSYGYMPGKITVTSILACCITDSELMTVSKTKIYVHIYM